MHDEKTQPLEIYGIDLWENGFNAGVEKARQIVRHENSICNSEIQIILDRILKAMEEMKIEQKSPEENSDDHQEKNIAQG